MGETYNIAAGFYRSVHEHGERICYADSGSSWTYREMGTLAGRLAAHLLKAGCPGRVGILGTRSMEAYAGILGAGLAGAAYVPINLKWPEERIAALLRMMELDALVVDEKGSALLTPAVLDAAPADIVIADAARPVEARSGHSVTRFGALDCEALTEPVSVAPEDLAYVMFTSGTTGMPKGVMVTVGALHSYLEQARQWTRFTPEDRIAETCDITFDLSVHDLFLCVEAGASLHVLSALEMLAPARFIRSREITAWLSVPTLAAMMQKGGALKPGMFPSLRVSQFCGEPLPESIAREWAAATPNGVVENIYGPTEATVVVTRQRVTDPLVVTESRNIVALGKAFDTMDVAIFDAEQAVVADGEAGEIAISGPQLAAGYLNAPEQTADRFRDVRGKRWYLTGDLGFRDRDGTLHHLGRIDNQIKLKGNRIELEEVEMHLRRAAQCDMVAVVAWPVIDGSAQGLVGFCVSGMQPDVVTETLLKTLPRYMVPGSIQIVDTLPVNVNGKVDRRALADRLQEGVRKTVETKKPSFAETIQ